MPKNKECFTSKEIAHIWANNETNGIQYGRVSGRVTRMKFDGDKFYSYGTVIARRIKYKGKVAIVRDNASFSNTTCKHQSTVANAIHHLTSFSVNIGKMGQYLEFTPQTLRDWYFQQYNEVEKEYVSGQGYIDQKPSRYKHINAQRLIGKVRNLDDAISVAKYFGIAKAKLEKERAKIDVLFTEASALCEDRNNKRNAKREERWAKQREKSAADEIKRKEQYISDIETLINPDTDPFIVKELAKRYSYNHGYNSYVEQEYLNDRPDLVSKLFTFRQEWKIKEIEKDRQDIIKWKNGENIEFPHRYNGITLEPSADGFNGNAYLRVKDDRVETSMGAQVLVKTVTFLWKLCKECRSSIAALGQDYINKLPILDHYKVNEIDNHGNIRVGCHNLAYSEIENIAIKLGLTNEIK